MDILSLSQSKSSQLCIGLDPKVDIEDRLNVSLELIDETHEFAVAYKPNRQFWLGSSISDLKKINERIHKYNCVSICDHKLSDIGSSNLKAIKTISEEKFDYLTISPFPGNIEQTCKDARDNQLGSICLVLMSNPESIWMMQTRMHMEWAKQANEFADGVVIGTTNHVTPQVIDEIAQQLDNKFVIAPGIGTQEGDMNLVLQYFGNKVIFNVSRGISESKNYREAAKKYTHQINQIVKKFL